MLVLLQIHVLSYNTKKGEIERTFYVLLVFCVLDANICGFLNSCLSLAVLSRFPKEACTKKEKGRRW